MHDDVGIISSLTITSWCYNGISYVLVDEGFFTPLLVVPEIRSAQTHLGWRPGTLLISPNL